MKKDYIQYVNPYIGTSFDPEIHSWGISDYGGTVPFVTAPFGMTKWSPQTRENKIGTAVYSYDDSKIMGFMATHQPAIWMGDYGYLSIMPEIGEVKANADARSMSFFRNDEFVSPYQYSVSLKDEKGHIIYVQMTATERCAKLRFTFPAGEAKIYIEVSRKGIIGESIFLDDNHTLWVSNPDRMDKHLSEIDLPNFRGFYSLHFSRNIDCKGNTMEEQLSECVQRGENLGAWVGFHLEEETTVEVDIGSSFISYPQAERNLQKEIGNNSFPFLCEKLKEIWNTQLGKIDISCDRIEQKQIFYTAMFHAMLFPHIFWEDNQYYSAFDDTIHNGKMYTSFSIWDTFRAENSLLTILFPEKVDEMINSLLHVYEEGGYLPKWPNPSYTNIMISTHADSLIAEAINKGFSGFDYELAWRAVSKDGLIPPPGDAERFWRDREPNLPYEARAGLTYLLDYGYIPTDKTAEAASRTIEGCYDDWCIAQVAIATNRRREAEYFLSRSKLYQSLLDPETHLLRGRKSDGSFALTSEGWTEGGQWNYHFFTPHDMDEMLQLVGQSTYIQQLDTYFEHGYNFHPNEPSHHVPYLYSCVGEYDKAKYWVEKIARENYTNHAASGLTGNEDCGQMSAWYIFATLGFYPVNPASGKYVLACPLVDSVEINIGEHRTFKIRKIGGKDNNQRVTSVLLNGEKVGSYDIQYKDIMSGGQLDYIMEDVT